MENLIIPHSSGSNHNENEYFDRDYFKEIINSIRANDISILQMVLSNIPNDIKKSILNKKTKTDRSLLYLSIEKNNNPTIVLSLLENGADFNEMIQIKTKSEFEEDDSPSITSPTSTASSNSNNNEYFIAKAKETLDYNKAAESESILHLISRKGYSDILKEILERYNDSIDKNSLDSLKRTPIILASANGKLECARLLILKGASVSSEDINGKTALHLSMDFNHDNIASMLTHNGGDISLRYHYRPSNRMSYVNQLNDANDLEILTKLDRYGNIVNDSDLESRHSKSIKSIKDIRPNSLSISTLNTAPIDKQRAKEIEKELSRALKWLAMMKKWKSESTKFPSKVKTRSVKGIPDRVRGQAWNLMAKTSIQLKNNPGKFESLLLSKSISEIEIDLDVNRAFRNNIQFRERYGVGQVTLFNVLKVYSNFDKSIGYTQGMSSIASLLVMYLPEQEAFWTFERLMNKEEYGMASLFEPGLGGVQKMIFVFDKLIEKYLPDLSKHFKSIDLVTSYFCVKWFIIGYLDSFPFTYCIRIWDLIFSHGFRIVYSIALAILKSLKKQLLKSDFSKCLETIVHYEITVPEDVFINYCVKNKVPSKVIENFEKKYVPPTPKK